MFSLYGIWKKWREWFSLARDLIFISWNKVLILTTFFKQDAVTLAKHKRREFLKDEFVLDEKSVPLIVRKFFIIISLALKGIIGSTFRKKWKIKTMVLSKSIIGSHYKELSFTWLFYFHFAEKCVTLGQGFYLKLFCFHALRRSQLFLPYIWIVCTDSYIVGIKVWKKK